MNEINVNIFFLCIFNHHFSYGVITLSVKLLYNVVIYMQMLNLKVTYRLRNVVSLYTDCSFCDTRYKLSIYGYLSEMCTCIT